MRNRILVGCAVFLLLLISQAPASLLRWAISSSTQATLIGSQGTLWKGSGELLVAGQTLGILSWDLQGVTILQGKLSYHVTLSSSEQNLTGELVLLPSTGVRAAEGRIDAVAVNRWLAPYNISLSGQFTLQDVSLMFNSGVPDSAGGEIQWQGGPISYQLANESSTGSLPPMTAVLGPAAEAAVFADGEQTPLLKAELQSNGFAKVGVTKLLTKMLNRPWPGSDADHEVVLEVEEQVF
jgi:hypothetical protein